MGENNALDDLERAFARQEEAKKQRLVEGLDLPSPSQEFGDLEDTWNGMDDRARQRMSLALRYGTSKNPDQEAEIGKLQVRTGLSPDIIRRNFDEVKQLADEYGVDVEAMQRSSPRLARWIEHPDNMALAHDDLSNLSGLEWAVKASIAAFQVGRAQADVGRKSFTEMHGGMLEGLGWDREANQRQIDYLERNVLPREFGAESWLGRNWLEFVKFTPMMLGGAASGATGALVVGQLGPQVGLPEELISVPMAAGAGAFAYTYVHETGFAHRQLSRLRDESGQPLPAQTVYLASSGAGALNAALELIGLGKMAKVMPGGRQLLSSIGLRKIEEHLKRKSFRAALTKFAADYGEGAATEAVTEMGQELTPILAGLIAKEIEGGDWDPEDWNQNIGDIMDVGLQTFEAMIVGGAFLSGPKFGIDVMDARRSAQTVSRLEAMTGSAKASKLRERSPAKFRELVDAMIEERGEVSHAYVRLSDWNEIFGARAANIAEEVLGSPKPYADAAKAGDQVDLVIPIGAYLEKVAPTEAHEVLTPHVRFYQSDMSAAEVDAAREDQADLITEAFKTDPATYDRQTREIYDREYRIQLQRGDSAEAEAIARLRAHVTATTARRAGKDPVELYEAYDVRLHGLTDPSAPPPRVTSTGQSVQALPQNPQTPEQQTAARRLERLRKGDRETVALAAKEMAERLPRGATLIPVPDPAGVTGVNLALATQMASQMGGTVARVLEAGKAGGVQQMAERRDFTTRGQITRLFTQGLRDRYAKSIRGPVTEEKLLQALQKDQSLQDTVGDPEVARLTELQGIFDSIVSSDIPEDIATAKKYLETQEIPATVEAQIEALKDDRSVYLVDAERVAGERIEQARSVVPGAQYISYVQNSLPGTVDENPRWSPATPDPAPGDVVRYMDRDPRDGSFAAAVLLEETPDQERYYVVINTDGRSLNLNLDEDGNRTDKWDQIGPALEAAEQYVRGILSVEGVGTGNLARHVVPPTRTLDPLPHPSTQLITKIGDVEIAQPVREDNTVNAGEISTLYQTRDYAAWFEKFSKDPAVRATYTAEELEGLRVGLENTAGRAGFLDLLPEEGKGSPIRGNDDPLFVKTFDITTICPRQDHYVNTIMAVERELGSILNPFERHLVGVMLRDDSVKPACWYSYGQAARNAWDWGFQVASNIASQYVDLHRAGEATEESIQAAFRTWKSDGVLRQFLDENADALLELKIEPVRLRDIARHHVEPRSDLERQLATVMRRHVQGGIKANSPKGWSTLRDQVLQMEDHWFETFNKHAGFRMNSQTDFRPWHVLEVAEFLAQLRARDGQAHVYTKEPAFVEIFGRTGIKFNISLSYATAPDGSMLRGESIEDFAARWKPQLQDLQVRERTISTPEAGPSYEAWRDSVLSTPRVLNDLQAAVLYDRLVESKAWTPGGLYPDRKTFNDGLAQVGLGSILEFTEEMDEEAGAEIATVMRAVFDELVAGPPPKAEPNQIVLDHLVVEKTARKAGLGTQFMQDLTEHADNAGQLIRLTPAQRDPSFGTTSRARLVRFYKRFGFVENKGRNKDFTLNADEMYRKPKPSQAKPQVGRLDPIRGMSGRDLDRFRKKYSTNVGGMMVSLNDEQTWAALDDRRVDMIIPYHAGTIPKAINSFEGAADYTAEQEENWGKVDKTKIHRITLKDGSTLHINPAEPISRAHHRNNKKRYLEICRALGIKERFRRFSKHRNYMKLVRDVARSPSNQSVVDPSKIDWKSADRVTAKWVEDGGDPNQADPVVLSRVLDRIRRNDWPEGLIDAEGQARDFESTLYAKDQKRVRLEQGPLHGTPETEPDGGERAAHARVEALRLRPVDTTTTQFRDWFKRSTVALRGGNPMPVYHGTKYPWVDLDDGGLGQDAFATDDALGLTLGPGAHFSADPRVANDFAGGTADDADVSDAQLAVGPRVYPVYISIQNPIRLTDKFSWSWENIVEQLLEMDEVDHETFAKWAEMPPDERPTAKDILVDLGYDGIVYLNRGEVMESFNVIHDRYREMFDSDPDPVFGFDSITDDEFNAIAPQATDAWVVFEPGQVKSSIANVGTFDPTKKSILFQEGQPPAPVAGTGPAFERWFEGSEVVDQDGKPLTVFHSTLEQIEQFFPNTHFGTAAAANERTKMLADFSVVTVGRDPGAPRTYPVHLSIKNPLRMKDLAGIGLNAEGVPVEEGEESAWFRAWENEEDFSVTLLEMGIFDIDEFEEARGFEEAVEKLKEKGYDGIVYKNEVEDAGQDSWIAFDPEQVKSAIANVGTFDPTKKSILHQTTDKFAQWFKQSVVVDADGNPLTVYHGTYDRTPGVGLHDEFRFPSWFTNLPTVPIQLTPRKMTDDGLVDTGPPVDRVGGAAAYAGMNDPDSMVDMDERAARIYPVHLSIQNPFYAQKADDPEDMTYYAAYEPDAIAELIEAGYDGIIGSGANEGETFFIPFYPEQIKSATGNNGNYDPESRSILEQPAGGKKGYIEFAPRGRKFDIHLLEGADVSTVLHETAHFYLEVLGDLAEEPGAATEIIEDYRKALAWIGVKSRDEIKREHHEKWARGFEQYILEGKAPTRDLTEVFARLKAWMMRIYDQVKELITLDDNIRGVFDRLVASEKEIKAAKADLQLGAMTPLRTLATEAEWERYQEATARADTESDDQLRAEINVEIAREQQDWYQAEKARITEEVRAEFAEMPLWRAVRFLQTGKMLDGTDVPDSLRSPDGKPLKLSKAIIIKKWGKEVLDALPRPPYVYRRKGGVDPDDVANQLGFGSGDGLLKAIQGAPRYEQAVEEQLDQRLKARHGSLLDNKKELNETALSAAQSDSRIEQLLIEARMLRRATDGTRKAIKKPPVDPSYLRDRAAASVRGYKVADLRPHIHQRAAAKHGQAAFKAAEAGDLKKAYDEKVLQMWNMMLFRAARDAKIEAEKTVRFARRMGQGPAQARLGKAGPDYADPVNEILEAYDFKPATAKAVRRRVGLREWIATHRDDGEEVLIPDDLVEEARRVHYRELSVDGLTEIRDALHNVNHLAKLKTTLIGADQRRTFERIKEELISGLEANLKAKFKGHWDPANAEALKGRLEFLRKWDARLLRIEEVIRQMDGGRIDGPWSTYVWNVITDAQTTENDLTADVVLKLGEAFTKLPRDRRSRMFDEQVHIESMGQDVSRQALLSIALNTGNESNFQRLVSGKPADATRWDDVTLNEMLNKLDRQDWEFVQAIWDTIESLWPKIEAMEKRLTGVAPPKVEPRAFTRTLPDGTEIRLRGGYFPLVYSKTQGGRAGRLQAQSGDTATLFDHNYVRAMTPHGHVIKRVEEYNEPLLFDLNVITRHLQQTAHDLAHREAVLSVYKIITDPDILRSMYDHLGEARAEMFMIWLRRIANDKTGFGDPFIESWMGKARMNATVVAMGFKATVTMQNLGNYVNVVEMVRPDYLAAALGDCVKAPNDRIEWIKGKSGEMRHRFNNLEREIRANMQSLVGKVGLKAQVQRMAFWSIGFTDGLTAYPAWLGAYRQEVDVATKEGLPETEADARAVRHADRVIRTTLSAGAPKDIAQIQSGGQMMKFYTMFYSWFSCVYMRGRALQHDVGVKREEGFVITDFAKFLARLMSFWIVPALLSEVLSARSWAHDDEDFLEWAGWNAIMYPFAAIPFVREASSALEWRLKGKYSRGVRFGPLGTAIEEVVKAAELLAEAPELLAGDKATLEKAAKRSARASGYLFGLPISQAEITVGYVYDLLQGEERPEDVLEFARNLVYRRPWGEKKKKRGRRRRRSS